MYESASITKPDERVKTAPPGRVGLLFTDTAGRGVPSPSESTLQSDHAQQPHQMCCSELVTRLKRNRETGQETIHKRLFSPLSFVKIILFAPMTKTAGGRVIRTLGHRWPIRNAKQRRDQRVTMQKRWFPYLHVTPKQEFSKFSTLENAQSI